MYTNHRDTLFYVVVSARSLGGPVLDNRAKWHTVANRDWEKAARGCLGAVPERMRLSDRPSHGAQTREILFVFLPVPLGCLHSSESSQQCSCFLMLCYVDFISRLDPEMTSNLVKCPSVCPCIVNIFKILRVRDRWADVDETWHV